MSDEIDDGSFGYLNHVASYVLGDIALRTGDPAALRTARRDAAVLYGTASGCATTKRLGGWLTVRLGGGPVGPELLDVLKPGYVHACSPLAHSDAVELVRLLLAAGQRGDAASVSARGWRTARTRIQAFPGCAPLLCTRAHSSTRTPNRPWPLYRRTAATPGRWSARAAFEDAGLLLPEQAKDEAVGYLDEALRLQSAAGAERDAARVRRLLREYGVQRAGGRPDPAAAHWPELTASELAVVQLVIQGATDREVAQRLYISAHTVNSHLRHVFAKLGIRSRVELAHRASQRQAAELPFPLLEQAQVRRRIAATGSRLSDNGSSSRAPWSHLHRTVSAWHSPPRRTSLIPAIPPQRGSEAFNHLFKSCAACASRSRLGRHALCRRRVREHRPCRDPTTSPGSTFGPGASRPAGTGWCRWIGPGSDCPALSRSRS